MSVLERSCKGTPESETAGVEMSADDGTLEVDRRSRLRDDVDTVESIKGCVDIEEVGKTIDCGVSKGEVTLTLTLTVCTVSGVGFMEGTDDCGGT